MVRHHVRRRSGQLHNRSTARRQQHRSIAQHVDHRQRAVIDETIGDRARRHTDHLGHHRPPDEPHTTRRHVERGCVAAGWRTRRQLHGAQACQRQRFRIRHWRTASYLQSITRQSDALVDITLEFTCKPSDLAAFPANVADTVSFVSNAGLSCGEPTGALISFILCSRDIFLLRLFSKSILNNVKKKSKNPK